MKPIRDRMIVAALIVLAVTLGVAMAARADVTDYIDNSRAVISTTITASDETIRALAKQGDICGVVGHSWIVMPNLCEVLTSYPSATNCTEHRECRLCGRREIKVQPPTPPAEWKEDRR